MKEFMKEETSTDVICKKVGAANWRITPRIIAFTGIIAALYAVATIAIAPLSFGVIQLRFSEVLVLLVFLDKRYSAGLILGCVIANCFSPMGMPDVIAGTLATTVALFLITKSKNLFIATLWPTICNGIIIGAELNILLGLPLFFSMLTVALGEFAVVTCIGYPMFRKILSQEKLLRELRF